MQKVGTARIVVRDNTSRFMIKCLAACAAGIIVYHYDTLWIHISNIQKYYDQEGMKRECANKMIFKMGLNEGRTAEDGREREGLLKREELGE